MNLKEFLLPTKTKIIFFVIFMFINFFLTWFSSQCVGKCPIIYIDFLMFILLLSIDPFFSYEQGRNMTIFLQDYSWFYLIPSLMIMYFLSCFITYLDDKIKK